MRHRKNDLNPVFEVDLLQAFINVAPLVSRDVLWKAKQYNTPVLVADDEGKMIRMSAEEYEVATAKIINE